VEDSNAKGDESSSQNKTWDLVKLPDGKVIGCKCVFTVKHNADCSVECYKARLMAKDCTQTYGIDYVETFTPVAKMNSIRVLLSIATDLDWPLHQFDVKKCISPLRSRRSIHGNSSWTGRFILSGKSVQTKEWLIWLKQSPIAWFEQFSWAIQRFGYKESQAN
jgi:hypothetical protein